MIRKIFNNWRTLWMIQILMMAFIALCATLLPLKFPSAVFLLRMLFLWILPCVAGAWSAFRLTCCGLNCYAAWLLPPIVHTAIPWLTIGYPPAVGSMVLCAMTSLVSAAAADVLCKQGHSR